MKWPWLNMSIKTDLKMHVNAIESCSLSIVAKGFCIRFGQWNRWTQNCIYIGKYLITVIKQKKALFLCFNVMRVVFVEAIIRLVQIEKLSHFYWNQRSIFYPLVLLIPEYFFFISHFIIFLYTHRDTKCVLPIVVFFIRSFVRSFILSFVLLCVRADKNFMYVSVLFRSSI